MSASFVPVSWNRTKWVYDAVLLAGIAGYVAAYRLAAGALPTAIDAQSLSIRVWGSAALILLTLVLAIGPLARLDARFLPLLYNRRHFGVITAIVATTHAVEVLGWYFTFSPIPPGIGLLTAEAGSGGLRGLPFLPFGMAALLILWVLAVTSHDFWLAFLTPPVWKRIHMAAYAACALAVAHVGFGAVQDSRGLGLALVLGAGSAGLIGLHLLAAARQGRARPRLSAWIDAGPVDGVPEGGAITVVLPDGAKVAIFRNEGRLSALTNRCAHQGGPLGEGRVINGCVTCPWHGFQYRVADGCAPAPFTERIATYRLARDGARLLLDPVANPPGTPVPPLEVAECALPPRGGFFIGWLGKPAPGQGRFTAALALGIALGLPLLGFGLGAAVDDPARGLFALASEAPVRPLDPAPRTLRGVLSGGPVPILHVVADTDGVGAVLLSGWGKAGIPVPQAQVGKLVEMGGVLVRRGDIAMLVGDGTITGVAGPAPALPVPVSLGRWRIEGEICDGKCYAGVMTPGTGLAHRACAAMCLAGEIPAVFVAASPAGGSRFFILTDAKGDLPPAGMRGLIGLPVRLEGELWREGTALIFRADFDSAVQL